jgi:hypothetical protein
LCPSLERQKGGKVDEDCSFIRMRVVSGCGRGLRLGVACGLLRVRSTKTFGYFRGLLGLGDEKRSGDLYCFWKIVIFFAAHWFACMPTCTIYTALR